jgi:hypothetical protein
MADEPENLRCDLLNPYGIDAPMLKFILAHGDNNPEVRAYIERRITAGNKSAVTQKQIMEAVGTW